ncbi:MAG: hypothetical protein ABFD86_08775 [Bryobacteraceae bacterium]
MTKESYKRWKDFSVRMARHGLLARGKRKQLTIAAVKSFFDLLESDYIGESEPPGEGWLDRVRSFCQTDAHPTCRDPYGYPEHGGLVCDILTEWLDNRNPYDWDTPSGKHWIDTTGSDISCCIRAGLDFAGDLEIGVLGFTAGDLRRMYPEGVPDWVTGGKECRWLKSLAPNAGLNGTFDKMSDETAIVM